jgi:hypothetical protein
MAKQPDRDDLDRTRPLTDEEERGLGDKEFDEDDEADEEADDDELTEEVGDEGGSPGDRKR